MEGLPSQISQYEIQEAKRDEKTEKCSFVMRVSNNIHNVACLDQVEFIQEWTEDEKIPIGKLATPPPKAEAPKTEASPKGEKEGAKAEDNKEGSAKKADEAKPVEEV